MREPDAHDREVAAKALEDAADSCIARAAGAASTHPIEDQIAERDLATKIVTALTEEGIWWGNRATKLPNSNAIAVVRDCLAKEVCLRGTASPDTADIERKASSFLSAAITETARLMAQVDIVCGLCGQEGKVTVDITEATAQLQTRLDIACEAVKAGIAENEKLQAEVATLTKKLSDEKTGRDFAKSDIQVWRKRAEAAECDLAAEKLRNEKLREKLEAIADKWACFSVSDDIREALLSAPVAPLDNGPCMFPVAKTTCGYPEGHEVHKRPYGKSLHPHHEFEGARPPVAPAQASGPEGEKEKNAD